MFSRGSHLLCAACLCLPATTQHPAAAATDRALSRAGEDALRSCRNLLAQPAAFRGSCQFAARGESEPTEIPFRGAWQDGLDLLQLRRHTVLSHGHRQLVRTDDGPWLLPQGDAADMPLSPRTLARHLTAATFTAAEPVFLDGHPAMRVHATWSATAAARLLAEATHPDPKAQQLLERLPRILERATPEQACVDAVVCFDPATRTLRTLVLRAALLTEPELHPDDVPTETTDGLPALRRRPLLQYTYSLALLAAGDVPLPPLDAAMRERLAWPSAAPAPATPPVK
jgi:hypothetical protein